MLSYYEKGGKAFSQNHNIKLPEQEDLDNITIDNAKLKKVLDITHKELSDRALSFLPTLIKNVMCVWSMSQDRAMVKTTELLVSKSLAKELAKTLVPAEIREIYNIIDGMGQSVSHEDYNKQYDRLELSYGNASKKGLLTDQDNLDISARIKEEESKLAFLNVDENSLNDLS